MATNRDYIDGLMDSLAPVVYPDGIPEEKDENEMDIVEAVVEQPEEIPSEEIAEAVVSDVVETAAPEREAIDDSIFEEEEIELSVDMSEEDIDALLNAAKSTAKAEVEEEKASSETEDILAMFADDENISDIKDVLDKEASNTAVDSSALEEKEIELPNLDDEEEEKPNKKDKKAKKPKKAKKEKVSDNADEKEKKPGFFAKIINALTEEVDDEEVSVKEQSETGITDENAQILSEIDAEEDKKGKKKKKEKKKKDKKNKQETEGGADDEESGEKPKKEKKKKEKKPKKEKVEAEDQKHEKKLPKKRVRSTFILCASILAAIVLLTFVLTELMNLQHARYAFDNAQYDVAYEDLYSLELKGNDKEIFDKSKTIMLLRRKITSYENYKKLGMNAEALDALLQGIDMYPAVHDKAVALGVDDEVNEAYTTLVNYLGGYGLSVADAEEINGYISRVMYNKRVQEIAGGSGFVSGTVESESEDGYQDILPEELDFLPDNM